MTRTPNQSVRLRLETLEEREVPAILYGVTASNFLVTFDSARPAVLLDSNQIAGPFLQGERITDIDARPGVGTLFGRSNIGRMYILAPSAALPFTTVAFPLQLPTVRLGSPLGFDFDPRNDQIRVVNPSGQNLLIDSFTGSLSRFGVPLAYAEGDLFAGVAPSVSGLAYNNNNAVVQFSRAFGIDHTLNTLVNLGGGSLADLGVLNTIGGLGVNVGGRVGFDIAPVTNASFASFQLNGVGNSRLYTINLGTGRASLLGQIGRGLVLNDLAVDVAGTSGFVSQAGFAARVALPPPSGGLIIAPAPGAFIPPIAPPVIIVPPIVFTSADITPAVPNTPGLVGLRVSQANPNTPSAD